ncbi:PAS domain S-box protein [Pedobacter heparinus]|uniref:sensor histidine kinase n=1 Tax=Pedobacter heparinus TaxID=984 RepID=UPI00293091FF|nr:PAS domain S-box protein [Pedobacter heparinus]
MKTINDLNNKINGYEQRAVEHTVNVDQLNQLIAQLKLAEEKSARLAAIVETSDDAIISKNLNSIITSWNNSAQRIFGYTAEEMIGQSILKLIPDDRIQEEPHILKRLKSGERVDHFETKRLTKDKKLIDVSLSISPIKDTKGNIIGLSKIARDITDKKQEEQRKNDFIALVSHELKTPLTSIKSYVQMMLTKTKKDADPFGVNLMSRAEVQVKKMTDMIHDFLSLSRLEAGKILYTKSSFKLLALMDEVVNEMQMLSPDHHIEFHRFDEAVTVYGDRDKIGQVMLNLLSNAVKYSPASSTVTVGGESIGKNIKIYVKDQGVGISPVDQKRLFERFYRVQNEQIKNISGFGIGLYLVAEILREHQSDIVVNSALHEGATFYFVLQT